MKKLIITAAIVIMAAVTHAATCTWSASAASTVLSDGTAASNCLAYLFEGTLTTSVLDKVAAGDWDQSGSIATKNASATGLITKAGIGSYENQTVTFSMILLNAADYATATQYKYATTTVEFGTKTATAAFATPLTNAQWTDISSVPEPTSGLLLLIGMAGLALKRKQA